jgi:putative membrane protein
MRQLTREATTNRDLTAGIVAGIIGGLAGAWMMNQYHSLVSTFQNGQHHDEDQGGRDAAAEPPLEIGGRLKSSRQVVMEPQQQENPGQYEPATEKAAAAVVTGVLGHEMSRKEKELAGSAVHYAFGASVGGVYGALAEVAPVVRTGGGTVYGTGVWLGADEVAVPALGLAKPPQEHPPSTHLNALGAHLVFGLTLEIVRRVVRAMI